MIKQMAWNTFKSTGSIDSYLELIELENIEKNMKNKQNINEEININKKVEIDGLM